MSMKELNGASNPNRNPDILPYMHLTLQERRKVAVLQRRHRFLRERLDGLSDGNYDHDKAEASALAWALGKLASTK